VATTAASASRTAARKPAKRCGEPARALVAAAEFIPSGSFVTAAFWLQAARQAPASAAQAYDL
jgi:hypothetical protein